MKEKRYKLKIKTYDGMTHTVSFGVPCGEDGKDGMDGRTPEKGVDYWTPNDKAEIVTEVLQTLPNASGVSF